MSLIIHIAYLIDTIYSDKAGTEKQLLEIIRRLNPEIFKPHLICLYESSWMRCNRLPCPVHILGYRGFFKTNFPAVIARLTQIVRINRIDIVQTFFEDAIFVGFFGTLFSTPRPVLITCRRDIGLGKDDLWYHALFKALLPAINSRFDGIVANGTMVRKYVAARERTPEKRITVIHNGIEMPQGACDTPEIFNAIKADLWIGITANLKAVKRIDVLLRGLVVLKTRSKLVFHAVILGEGPEEQALKTLAEDLRISSNVHFMGSVNNVYAYLKHLDIGVLCSDREGFSNAILEYMACGLPVVATAVGGNTELVDDTNGILVPAGNVEALSTALLKLAESPDLRQRMGDISRKRINEDYDWDKIMAQWQSYYGGLIQR